MNPEELLALLELDAMGDDSRSLDAAGGIGFDALDQSSLVEAATEATTTSGTNPDEELIREFDSNRAQMSMPDDEDDQVEKFFENAGRVGRRLGIG